MNYFLYKGRRIPESKIKDNLFRDGDYMVRIYYAGEVFSKQIAIHEALKGQRLIDPWMKDYYSISIQMVDESGHHVQWCGAIGERIRIRIRASKFRKKPLSGIAERIKERIKNINGDINIRKYCAQLISEGKSIYFVFAELADLLSLIEQAGVIHNDLVPENILINRRLFPGRPFLWNFHQAKTICEPVDDFHLCRSAEEYCAPEKDYQEVSIKSDIYSFGKILESCMSLNPKGYESYSQEAKEVVEKCCSEKPEQRYASFREVKDVLKEIFF